MMKQDKRKPRLMQPLLDEATARALREKLGIRPEPKPDAVKAMHRLHKNDDNK